MVSYTAKTPIIYYILNLKKGQHVDKNDQMSKNHIGENGPIGEQR
jgi:hypothetical protein